MLVNGGFRDKDGGEGMEKMGYITTTCLGRNE